MTGTKLSQSAEWRSVAGEFYWVDVGSRGGFAEMSMLHPLVHMYSVDADETVQVKQGQFKSLHHFPLALHSSSEACELFVTRHPGMSSLLEFDQEVFTRHFGLMPASEIWRDGLTATHTQSIQAQTADEFFESQNLPRIDFLKLDTQGTELEILRGAEKFLNAGRVFLIKTEVSFHSVYKNQCRFSDIDHFLRSRDFLFIDVAFYPDRVYEQRKPAAVSGVGIRESVRFSAGGDAIYLLNPRRYPERNREECVIRVSLLLNQLGYVSVAFDLLRQFGYRIDLAESLLMQTTMNDRKRKLKRAMHFFLPPSVYHAVLHLSRTLNSSISRNSRRA